MLSANGGWVFCGNCEKIVGSINASAYNFITLIFCCTCGNYGCIEISRGKMRYNAEMRSNKMPSLKRGVCCCSMCDEKLFSILEGKTETYSFFVECKCGEKYDVKPNFEKRLGETLKLFEKAKEKR